MVLFRQAEEPEYQTKNERYIISDFYFQFLIW